MSKGSFFRAAWGVAFLGVVFWMGYLGFFQQVYRGADFSHYWPASSLLLHGENPYPVDFSKMAEFQFFQWGDKLDITHATNPPALAWALMPLALLPPLYSWWAWVLFSGMVFSWALAQVFAGALPEGRREKDRALFFLGLVVVFSFPMENWVRHSQVTPVLAALTVLSWLLFKKGKPGAAGLLLGIATGLKFYTWPIVFFLLGWRNWRAWIFFGLGLMGTLLAPFALPIPGLYEGWREYGLGTISAWSAGAAWNAGLVGLAGKATAWLGVNAPRSLFTALAALIAGVVCYLLGVRERAKPGTDGFDLRYMLAFGWVAFLAPVSWPHYALHYFFILVIAAGSGRFAGAGVFWLMSMSVPAYLLIFLVGNGVFFSWVAVVTAVFLGWMTWGIAAPGMRAQKNPAL